MTRLLIASLALTAALVGAPNTATGQSAGSDSVTGTASECVEFIEPGPGQIICARRPSLDINVESGPGGENPTGTATLSSLGLTPGGSVTVVSEATCLSVTGAVAIVGVAGTQRQGGSGGEFENPIAGLLRIVDAGGPNSGADTVEFAYQTGDALGPPLPGPTTCSTFPGPFPTNSSWFPNFSNAEGDLVVIDTPALPTSKDQCRKGGWRSYGVFKNQGDCVSFVREQARRACIFELVAHGRPAFRAKYGIGPQRVLAMWSCVHAAPKAVRLAGLS